MDATHGPYRGLNLLRFLWLNPSEDSRGKAPRAGVSGRKAGATRPSYTKPIPAVSIVCRGSM